MSKRPSVLEPASAAHAPETVPSLTPPLERYDPPRTPWLQIIYEDDHLCVLDKQSGLLTVPGKAPEHADSLQSRAIDQDPNLRLVHRLDMGTSGIIVMARTPAAQRHLGLQFERRHVSKRYIAWVLGVPRAREGTIDLPLRCDWPYRPRQMVCQTHGRRAVTHWQICAQEHRDGHHMARLALRPVTGRSHQLRVPTLLPPARRRADRQELGGRVRVGAPAVDASDLSPGAAPGALYAAHRGVLAHISPNA
ncbi:MAG: pseudouridine synthase [Pseudomonadota bacterium]